MLWVGGIGGVIMHNFTLYLQIISHRLEIYPLFTIPSYLSYLSYITGVPGPTSSLICSRDSLIYFPVKESKYICFDKNQFVLLYVQFQFLDILSLDTFYDHVKNLQG